MSETPIFTSVEHDLQVSYDDLAAEPTAAATPSPTTDAETAAAPAG